jgi:hypothetical protein
MEFSGEKISLDIPLKMKMWADRVVVTLEDTKEESRPVRQRPRDIGSASQLLLAFFFFLTHCRYILPHSTFCSRKKAGKGGGGRRITKRCGTLAFLPTLSQ